MPRYEAEFEVVNPRNGHKEMGAWEGEMPDLTHARAKLHDVIIDWFDEYGVTVEKYEVKKLVEWRSYTFGELEWAVARVRRAKNCFEEAQDRSLGDTEKWEYLYSKARIHLNTVIDAHVNGIHFPVEHSA